MQFSRTWRNRQSNTMAGLALVRCSTDLGWRRLRLVLLSWLRSLSAFLGAWSNPGQLPPIVAATLGALVTTWTTFVPCFFWIFLGGPHIEQLRGNEGLTTALSAVTAAVVGVVLNLAVWFGLHVVFPAANTVDWFAVIVGAVAFIGMTRWKWDIIPVVLGAGLVGWLFKMLIWRNA